MKNKIMTERRDFKKLRQMCDFVLANRDRFAPASPASKAVPGVIAAVKNLKTLTASQGSLENRLRELARAKSEARNGLREEVEFLYHTASAVAAGTPGFDDRFQMRLLGDSKLLNAARSAVQDAAPLAATFVKHAMPAEFLESLRASIRKFEEARQEHARAKTLRALGRKRLQESLRQALAAGRRFDAIMRNTFRNDRITLEAWKRACRVRRGARTNTRDVPDASQPDPETPAPAEQPEAEPQTG